MTQGLDSEIVGLNMVEDAYLVASGQKSWADFIKNFDAFPAVKLTMLDHDKTFAKFDTVIPHNFDPAYIKSYIDYYYQINPKSAYTQKMIDNPDGVWGHQSLETKTLEKTEYYADWLKPQGNIAGGFGYNLIQDNNRYISLISQVSFDHIAEAQEIERLLKKIGGRLKRALMLQKNLANQTIEPDSYEHVLNCLQNPVILTDKKGRFHFANKWADKLLSKGDVISLNRSNILTFKDPKHNTLAKQQLHNLTSEKPLQDSLSLRLPTKNGSFISLFASPITVTPIETNNFESFWKAPGHIAWFFISPQPLYHIDYRMVASVLQVTQTEAKLALSLMNGHSLKEYSLIRKVSKETARSQLRSLREKTGTKNQADLVGMLNRIFGSVMM